MQSGTTQSQQVQLRITAYTAAGVTSHMSAACTPAAELVQDDPMTNVVFTNFLTDSCKMRFSMHV